LSCIHRKVRLPYLGQSTNHEKYFLQTENSAPLMPEARNGAPGDWKDEQCYAFGLAAVVAVDFFEAFLTAGLAVLAFTLVTI
jgi:hypothetical protein